MKSSHPRAKAGKATQVRLKPADPFELIRWLARSQSDPRKAVAELVQNSLDAGARRISVERRRVRGVLCLAVQDDGEGVLPELGREAALHYLATHVGHSHKLGLDPAERHRRVIAGKYGVGLLGFWSVGRRLELRSRVAGSELRVLRLEEDSPAAEIVELSLRTDAPATYTEAVVLEVHPAAARALGGRRLADYLGAELRGQLLAREVDVRIHDRVARGLAQKEFRVAPPRFVGAPLALPSTLEVAGWSDARVELYLASGEDPGGIRIACAGTLVADDIAELSALGLAESPWVGESLVGLIDFPDFSVPPGTRRGVIPDAAAEAFVRALRGLEPRVREALERFERERRAAADRNVVRELRRAMRGFRQRLPQYDLPAVEGADQRGSDGEPGAVLEEERDATAAPEPLELQPSIFPPGPLARVRIIPDAVEIPAGGERRIRAAAVDADDRPVKDVELVWRVLDDPGAGIEIRGEGTRPALRVRPDAPLGLVARIGVEARQDARAASAEATVTVVEDAERMDLGIPEPALLSDYSGRWRSRMNGPQWEVNDAHPDYLALRSDPRARLRYLLSLLSLEIVLRSASRPDARDLLDSVVEILAHVERNLRGA